jgi:hypothetical protein
MTELWHGVLTGACLTAACSGGGNAAYFGAVAARSGEPGRRLGAQVLTVVNAAVALHGGVQALALLRNEPVAAGMSVVTQLLAAAGALATSLVVLRRVLASRRPLR